LIDITRISHAKMHRIIFGCGYLGSRVAARWRDRGDDVTIVTRNAAKAAQMTAAGYRALVADVTQPASLRDLPAIDTLLYAIGYDRSSGHSIHEVYANGLRHVLDAIPSVTGRVVYISTTGVYGDAGGASIDEDTTPAPVREGGRASLAAEDVLRLHPMAKRGVVLRLAGIYGPDRVPFLQQLRAGLPIPAIETGNLNLIHVDDAAEVVLLASNVSIPRLPRVYCVSDGCPVLRGEYYREVARQIGAPPPEFVAPDAASPRAVRAQSDRRVSNDRLIRELRVTLRCPSYREGLAAILG
jgi:nucleoside-diphosphate-sugar epimerase